MCAASQVFCSHGFCWYRRRTSSFHVEFSIAQHFVTFYTYISAIYISVYKLFKWVPGLILNLQSPGKEVSHDSSKARETSIISNRCHIIEPQG